MTEAFHIEKATPDDLTAILDIYARGRGFQREHGNTNQWVNGYPQPQLVRDDIAKGQCYTLRDRTNTLLAVFVFAVGEEPTYAEIDGAWLNNAPYGYVHRICSAGLRAGAGRDCLDWAFAQCGNLRIDTHRDNLPMQHTLAVCGFVQCGTIHLANGAPRLAFQKIR